MSNLQSIMTATDAYKVSMWEQYPAGTKFVYSYIESRGGKYAETEFLGVQALAKYLAIPITQPQLEFADKFWAAAGEPFNRAGWQYILDVHGGRLPIKLRAAKEGLIIPTKNVLATIVNTDPNVPWLTTWVETPALRAIWYPTTVGTMSWNIKQLIAEYLEKSGDPTTISFKLHDFGARGVSSAESAGIGGAAHLVNFMGTDTMSGVLYAMDTYGGDVCGFSIPAAEHSTITSWGRENEVDAYRNMIKQFGKPGAVFAVVSDSYDIYNACKLWGTVLKDDVIASGATLVIRPDSGDPIEVLPKMMSILEHYYGAPKNAKGYKVLNNVRVLWGDGINAQSLETILRHMVDYCGYSADNFAFGMGGGLLQQLDRDTQQFAMKCSSVGIRVPDGRGLSSIEYRDVFKDPITDSGKASKKGRVTLWDNGAGEYQTSVKQPMNWSDKGFSWQESMETYLENGVIGFTQTFDQVRANSNLSFA
jgi:nicotinamide phosphoribosyltransferase